jgi:hypothetical protein
MQVWTVEYQGQGTYGAILQGSHQAELTTVILTDCPLFEPSCPGRIGWLTARPINVGCSRDYAEIRATPIFSLVASIDRFNAGNQLIFI